MYIENGNTLVVKSGIDYFEKERSGKKPNTWRYICKDDTIPKIVLRALTKIRVINGDNQVCSFTRDVTDTSFFGDVVIISWEHEDGTN